MKMSASKNLVGGLPLIAYCGDTFDIDSSTRHMHEGLSAYDYQEKASASSQSSAERRCHHIKAKTDDAIIISEMIDKILMMPFI